MRKFSEWVDGNRRLLKNILESLCYSYSDGDALSLIGILIGVFYLGGASCEGRITICTWVMLLYIDVSDWPYCAYIMC